MSRTLRILLIVLVVVIVGAGAVFFFLSSNGGGGGTPNDNDGEPRPTSTPAATQVPTDTPTPVVKVLIAAQDIPRGVEIRPDMLRQIDFPLEYLPQGTFSEIADVTGRIARTDISREQFIQARQILEGPFSAAAAQLARSGSDAAAVLDSERVAISLPIDAITSVAYAVAPGDSVDVLVSMLFVDVDADYQTILPNDNQTLNFPINLPPAGCAEGTLPSEFCVPTYNIAAGAVFTGNQFEVIPINTGSITLALPVIEYPGEEQRPRLVTQRTVTDARVIFVGEYPTDGRLFRPAATPTPIPTPTTEGEEPEPDSDAPPTNTPVPPRPEIITLGVTPQDAVVLTYMAEAKLPMTFALRSARSVGLRGTEPVTLQYIMGTYGIAVPETADYALEPAIRSIRQLSLGDQISLESDE